MSNPYSAPDADMSGAPGDDEPSTPRMFSIDGRIGRIRFLAYCWGYWLLISLAAAALLALGLPEGATKLCLYLPALFVAVMLAKRRLGDLDRSGGLGFLMLLPLLNLLLFLYLSLAPGNPDDNEHGGAPAKNTTPLLIAALAPLLVFVIGIAAALLGRLFGS